MRHDRTEPVGSRGLPGAVALAPMVLVLGAAMTQDAAAGVPGPVLTTADGLAPLGVVATIVAFGILLGAFLWKQARRARGPRGLLDATSQPHHPLANSSIPCSTSSSL
ncbi:MAG: hypothetical protein AAGN82_20950 [Myxococcota bacterium]